MLSYRIIRAVTHGYPLAMLFLYIGTLLLALSMMFVFPPGTILLLWLALGGLVLVIIVARLLSIIEHLVARTILRAGSCPHCGHGMQTIRDETQPWQCEWCLHEFAPSSAERSAGPDASAARPTA